MANPQINTYHCLCTSLLLATTHTLSSLPRRASPSLDNAIIVPLPPAPQPPSPPSEPEDEVQDEDASDDEEEEEEEGSGSKHTEKKPERPQLSELGYTLLLSTTLDRRPTLIRRSDGFERRHLLRCGRCRLVVGYELDAEHYATTSEPTKNKAGTSLDSAMDVDGVTSGGKDKERTKIVYLLPGGIMSTEVMASGRKFEEKDIVLGENRGAKAVVAWES